MTEPKKNPNPEDDKDPDGIVSKRSDYVGDRIMNSRDSDGSGRKDSGEEYHDEKNDQGSKNE